MFFVSDTVRTKRSKKISKNLIKMIPKLETLFKRLEEYKTDKEFETVCVHYKLSSFAMKFCMQGLVRTPAKLGRIRFETDIPGIKNYFLVGRCLSLLPSLNMVEVLVTSYRYVVELFSPLVFDSLTVEVLFRNVNIFGRNQPERAVFHYILKRGVESHKVRLGDCRQTWCKHILKIM